MPPGTILVAVVGALMSHVDFDLNDLSRYLHVTPAQVQKMAERGTLPGRKVAGAWRFPPAEIHHWLEERIGAADDVDLTLVEGVLNRAGNHDDQPAIRISELLPQEAVAIPLAARTKGSAISAMVELAAQTGHLWDAEQMTQAVRAREGLHPTALENGVALLHPRRPLSQILAQPVLALGITSQGIPFGESHGQLTDIFFLICSTSDAEHLRILARLSRLISLPGFLGELRSATDSRAALALIRPYEEKLEA